MASDPAGTEAAITQEKARLRREVIAQRTALSPAKALDAARRAVHHLWSLAPMANARNLAIYLPVGSELDCTPVATQAWTRGKDVLVPVIDGATLSFAPLTPKSELRRNFLGILEPVTPRRNLRSARQLDVIVAPLLAFDEAGHRLGMGGGYYDRTLAFLNARSRQRRPHFIGIAFEMQRRSSVPVGELDVRLNFVATDQSAGRFT